MAYTLGIDFGTLSGRAVLVDAENGAEIASAMLDYPHGVMDEKLPNGRLLPPEWALQHPQDYLEVLTTTIPAVLRQSGIDPAEVKALGVDFTASTPLPVTADGIPLCFLPQYADEPHSYVKLWKHHASQPQADLINITARQRHEPWLKRYGNKCSSEWFFSKLLQVFQEAPAIYHAMDNFIEAADWITWQLTGVLQRNTCSAGYKMLMQDGQYPSPAFFGALHPNFSTVVADKVPGPLAPLGSAVGTLTAPMAAKLGLTTSTVVAVPVIDAHVTLPAVKATEAGILVMIMGTSTCHIISAHDLKDIEGIAGVVNGGVVDGLYGYEAGQSAVGDIFAWFVDQAVPPEYHAAAKAAQISLHAYLEQEAAKQKPGEHGLLALDWWNGNRSTLMNADLSGLLVGFTLATRAPDIYRALIEATAYGTREIIEAYETQGIPVTTLVAAGGLPEKNALLRQIYADVTNRPLQLAGAGQSAALGAAIHAAAAAGLYPSVSAAAQRMGKLKDTIVMPIPEHVAVYEELFKQYKTLYNYFGRGANEVMSSLKRIRHRVQGDAHIEQ